jgi:hypothetical protein
LRHECGKILAQSRASEPPQGAVICLEKSAPRPRGTADAPFLLESTGQFADACSKSNSEQLSLDSLVLQGCASEMDLLASSALKFFFQLESTMLQLERDIAASPSAQAWWTGQRLFEAARAIDHFLDPSHFARLIRALVRD